MMVSHLRLKLLAACLLVMALGWVWWAWRRAKRDVQTSEVHAVQGLVIEYILTPERVNAIGGIRGTEFDVEPNGNVLVGNSDGLLEITRATDGIHVDQITDKSPDSFCLDGQGSLLSISQQYFGQLENNEFSQAVPLPYKNMKLGVSSLAESTYLFGGDGGEARRVYAFFGDGTLQIEAQIPENVIAVSDNSAAVYIASPQTVYRVTSRGIETVLRAPDGLDNIVSIALSADDKELFFATEKETFLMSGLSAVAVLPDIGGTLRFRNRKLYVWSPVRRTLIAVSGVDDLVRKAKNEQ